MPCCKLRKGQNGTAAGQYSQKGPAGGVRDDPAIPKGEGKEKTVAHTKVHVSHRGLTTSHDTWEHTFAHAALEVEARCASRALCRLAHGTLQRDARAVYAHDVVHSITSRVDELLTRARAAQGALPAVHVIARRTHCARGARIVAFGAVGAERVAAWLALPVLARDARHRLVAGGRGARCAAWGSIWRSINNKRQELATWLKTDHATEQQRAG